MYNPQIIIDLIESSGKKKRDLLDFMGKNWNGSVEAIIKGDIRVSKIEKIADFFGVPIDTFFDRETPNSGVMIGGVRNKVHHFTVGSTISEIKNLQTLIAEKDKRIEALEEIVALLKKQNPAPES